VPVRFNLPENEAKNAKGKYTLRISTITMSIGRIKSGVFDKVFWQRSGQD